MKILIKSVILGLFLYTIHYGSVLIWNHFYGKPSGYIGGLGAFAYGLIFALWGYILLSGLYIKWAKADQERKTRYYKGGIIVIIGYFLSRIPDIIDNDFFHNFRWEAVIFFILLIPILVKLEFWLRRK